MTVPAVSVSLWIGVGLGITLVLLAGAGVLVWTRRACPPEERRVSAVEAVLWAAIVITGVWLRFGHVSTLNGGVLTMDEAQSTRTYISEVIEFAPAEFGGTYLTQAWLLDGWYELFGVGTYSARYYTAAITLVGLVLFFATLSRLLNRRVAAWAAALLAVSTYAVHFAVFAVEVGILQFGLPLGAFAFVVWLRRPTALRSCVCGLVLGLSLFTYPGVLVGYAAILAGWAVCWTAARARGRAPVPNPFAHVSPRSWILFTACFAAVVGTGAILHARVYTHIHGLFAGGGSLDLSWSGFEESLPIVLHDLFVETTTWLEIFRHTPFVDWTYWPLALVGAWCLWTRRGDWVSRGVVLSVPLVILFAVVCGAYPGMRRALYILMPVSAFAALGVDALYARAGRWVGSLIVVLVVGHPVYYQMTIGRQDWRTASFGASFGADPIPDTLLLEALEKHEVIMSADEYPSGWDRNRLIHYWKLARRHGALRERTHALTFVSARDPARVAELADRPDAALLTWSPERVLPAMAKPAGLCFGLTDLQPRPALIPIVTASRATARDVCLWEGGRETALTSCVRLGHAHPLSHLVHGLVCENAYCESSRPETSYVEPGSVSFRLKPPGRGPVRLVVRVAVLPPWERANRVMVNGHEVGALDRSALDVATARLRLDIPASAETDRDFWTVTLGPGGHPGQVGWDVVWVALVPGGRAAPPPGGPEAGECPTMLCVGRGEGRVCEETKAPPPS